MIRYLGEPESLRRQWLLAAAILALVFLAYAPALRGGFVWDDYTFLVENRIIKAPDGLYRFWFTTEPSDYFPLTSSLMWVEWRLWGMQAWKYHVVNVLLHGLSAVLLWRVLRRLAAPGAWLAGALFAVHPVAAASAAWITEGKNTLSLVFVLLSMLAYLKSCAAQHGRGDRRSPFRQAVPGAIGASNTSSLPGEGRPPVAPTGVDAGAGGVASGLYVLSLALFAMALLAKTSVVMLPVVLLLVAWWQRGRISRRDLLRTAPFFALSLALGLVTVWFQWHNAMSGEVVRSEGLASRIAASGWVAWFYLGKLVLPVGLCALYPRWSVDAGGVAAWLPLAGLVAALALLWSFRGRWGRGPFVALAYFLIMLLPVAGLVDMAFTRLSLVADHLQYAAMPGVLALAAALLATACKAPRPAGWAAVAASGVCVLALAGLTWQRAAVYSSEERLWQDAIARNPNAWLPWNNLGTARHRAGDAKGAVECFTRAIERKQDYAKGYFNRGSARADLRLFTEAIEDFTRAIALKPDFAEAYLKRADALARLNRNEEALADYDRYIARREGSFEAYYSRATVRARLGQFAQAIPDFDRAIALKPGFANAYHNRAVAWFRLKKYDKALADLKKIEELGEQPDPNLLRAVRQAATAPPD